MKKRLLCLLLCLMFVLSGVLVGCSKEEEEFDDTSANKTTMTLGVHLVSEKEVSAEQTQKIEDAVNAITKNQFRIKLELHYYTADEYADAMEMNFYQMNNHAGDVTQAPETSEGETTEAETVVNEYGQTELKYPAIADYQADIFYISGYEQYNEYFNNGYLARLEDTLLQQVRTYISPLYLDTLAQLNKRIYALPTNTQIGEYTYLMVNKEVMNLMNKTASDFTSLTCDEVQDLLQYVDNYHRDAYIPLVSYADMLDFSTAHYWGVDEKGKLTNEFSLLGGMLDPSYVYMQEGNFIPAGNLLQTSSYVEELKTVKSYEFNGYFGTETEMESGKNFAVGYITGGAELIAEYGDEYEMIPIGLPRLTTEDLYGNMFAIHATNTNPERTMNILTYMNTNEDFRNLLLYGIEGENYELVDSEYTDEEGVPYKVVRRLNDDYVMDTKKLGNTLIGHTLEGENPLAKEYAKQQNLDALPSLYLGFDMTYKNNKVDMKNFHELREYSAEIKAKILACKTAEELDALIISTINEMALNPLKMKHANKNVAGTGSDGCSFAFVYYQWLEDNDLYEGN